MEHFPTGITPDHVAQYWRDGYVAFHDVLNADEVATARAALTELVQRMAEDGRQSGRRAVAEMYETRAAEYREYADMIRRVMLHSLDPKAPEPES